MMSIGSPVPMMPVGGMEQMVIQMTIEVAWPVLLVGWTQSSMISRLLPYACQPYNSFSKYPYLKICLFPREAGDSTIHTGRSLMMSYVT